MFDDDENQHENLHGNQNDQYGFWTDEPTGPLDRIRARRGTAGPSARTARTKGTSWVRRRPGQLGAGTREHSDTQQIPVVTGAVQSVRSVTEHVDPLLRRVGVLMLALALCVPVALAVRGGDDNRDSLQPQGSELVAADSPAIEGTLDVVDAEALTTDATVSTIDIDALPEAIPVVRDSPSTAAAASAAPASGTQPAARVESAPATTACATYEVVAGDYWILIAEKISVSLRDLLAVNGAKASTGLYPGRTVCVPAGASAPTTATPTPAAPTPAKPTPTTAKPAPALAKPTPTTVKAAPAPKKTYTRAEVESIIRAVWPDELENEAIRIATRESNLQPGVRNFCCFGLFQIYFNVHKSWLAQLGITSAEQLYNPLVNAHAAYTLYQRAGGWGPWKL